MGTLTGGPASAAGLQPQCHVDEAFLCGGGKRVTFWWGSILGVKDSTCEPCPAPRKQPPQREPCT